MYQTINPEAKEFKILLNSKNNNNEEAVIDMVDMIPGKLTFRENRLIIYDSNNKAYTFSLYLPKMIPDSNTKKHDGLKKIPLGSNKSGGKYAIRIRYHTGNWIFIVFPSKTGEKTADFLVREYKRLRKKKMLSHEMRLGKLDEYNELRRNLVESFEKTKISYSKPRVFDTDNLPYSKYYPWLKYEKVGRRKRVLKKVYVERRKSNEYFKNNTKFQAILMDIGFRASSDDSPIEIDPEYIDEEATLGLATGEAVLRTNNPFVVGKMDLMDSDVHDANNPEFSVDPGSRSTLKAMVPFKGRFQYYKSYYFILCIACGSYSRKQRF